MRSASIWVLSIHWRWLAMVSLPRCRRMALLARMTVSRGLPVRGRVGYELLLLGPGLLNRAQRPAEKTRFKKQQAPAPLGPRR